MSDWGSKWTVHWPLSDHKIFTLSLEMNPFILSSQFWCTSIYVPLTVSGQHKQSNQGVNVWVGHLQTSPPHNVLVMCSGHSAQMFPPKHCNYTLSKCVCQSIRYAQLLQSEGCVIRQVMVNMPPPAGFLTTATRLSDLKVDPLGRRKMSPVIGLRSKQEMQTDLCGHCYSSLRICKCASHFVLRGLERSSFSLLLASDERRWS